MSDLDILTGKRVLLVDDEPDILETLSELLDMCVIDTSSSFLGAVRLLKQKTYHIAILDIMGVNGYDLLEATRQLKIPTIMLTANAFSPDHLKKSIECGADAYIPKEKLVDITTFTADVLRSRQEGKTANMVWFSLVEPVLNTFFGTRWREDNRVFWDEFDKKHPGSEPDRQKMT